MAETTTEVRPGDIATVLNMVIEVIEDRAPEETEAMERLASWVDEARPEAPEGSYLIDTRGQSCALHAVRNW